MELAERQHHRAEVMRKIVHRRGKPFNDTVREYAKEYYETLALEFYPGDREVDVVSRKLIVDLNMDSFDDDFLANYVLFGKWLRQS